MIHVTNNHITIDRSTGVAINNDSPGASIVQTLAPDEDGKFAKEGLEQLFGQIALMAAKQDEYANAQAAMFVRLLDQHDETQLGVADIVALVEPAWIKLTAKQFQADPAMAKAAAAWLADKFAEMGLVELVKALPALAG